MNESRSNAFVKIWQVTVGGAFVWWCLGLNLFIYHLAAIFLFLALIHEARRTGQGIYMPYPVLFIIPLFVVYFFSVLIHVASADAMRCVAAFYNLSFWGKGILLMIVMFNVCGPSQPQWIFRPLYLLAVVMGVLFACSMFFWEIGVRSLEFPTPLYGLTRYLGQSPLLENSLLVRTMLWDWFASLSRPRFNALSPYPTATGGILIILLFATLTQAAIERRRTHFSFWFIWGLNFIALFFTLSRISVIAFFSASVALFLLKRRNFIFWVFFTTGVLILAIPLVEKMMVFFMGLREGSNVLRIDIYRSSLDQLEGFDWIFGLGIKPREETSAFPLGSHSTYISLLYKSGIVGCLCFVLFQVSLLWRWYHLRSQVMAVREVFLFWLGLGGVLMALAIWMATEDIDAPQFLCFLYFSWVGIFEGFRRRYKE